MNSASDHLKILVALRDASALRREPGPLTPDGHERWFTLTQLISEGRLVDACPPTLSAPARSLRKHTPYVVGKTLYTRVYYSITDAGREYLEGLERTAGVTALTAAELALEQAETDMHQAVDRYHEARAGLAAARREAGARGSLNVLLDAMKETAR
jgi:hypothetical protein